MRRDVPGAGRRAGTPGQHFAPRTRGAKCYWWRRLRRVSVGGRSRGPTSHWGPTHAVLAVALAVRTLDALGQPPQGEACDPGRRPSRSSWRCSSPGGGWTEAAMSSNGEGHLGNPYKKIDPPSSGADLSVKRDSSLSCCALCRRAVRETDGQADARACGMLWKTCTGSVVVADNGVRTFIPVA